MKGKWKFLALGLVVVALSAWSGAMLATTVPVRTYGPYAYFGAGTDSAGAPSSNSVGGLARLYVAKSTDTLKVGDVVFIDTLNAVSKSATLANYNKLAGVVIGGRSLSQQASIAQADVGTTAALPNRPVWVLKFGRAWVQVDTVTAGLTSGNGVIPSSTTAGLIRARTTAIDTFNRVIGRSLNGGAASAKVLIEVNVR